MWLTGYNIILVGLPGAGKTILAKRIPGILPRFDFKEALEIQLNSSCFAHYCRFGRRRRRSAPPPFGSHSLPEFGSGELGSVIYKVKLPLS